MNKDKEQKEVQINQSLMDDGSYLEEDKPNNKVLFIVLGVVIATLSVGGAVMMFSGGGEATVVDQPTTPSITLTENQTQTEELVPIEVEPIIEEIGEPDTIEVVEPTPVVEATPVVVAEPEPTPVIEATNEAPQAIEEQATYEPAPQEPVVAEAEASVSSGQTYTTVYNGVSYTVTQEQMDRATIPGFGHQSVDGIPTGVFSSIANAGVVIGGNDLTSEEFAAQKEDTSNFSSTIGKWQ